MKVRYYLLAATGIALAALLVHQQGFAKSSHGGKGGTGIFHFMVRSTMTSSGFDADAAGAVQAKRNQQGNADNQRLQLQALNLDANATYKLLAQVGTDTNLVEVADLTTDENGVLDLKYVKKNNGNASPGGDPLPDVLNPISNIRALEVSIGGTQAVLSADFTAPQKLQYLIKRTLTNDGVELDAAADLRIKATQSAVQFRVRASGLTPTNMYSLALNGVILADYTSGTDGHLDINALPAGAPDVLDITDLAIVNATTNSVLSTTLP